MSSGIPRYPHPIVDENVQAIETSGRLINKSLDRRGILKIHRERNDGSPRFLHQFMGCLLHKIQIPGADRHLRALFRQLASDGFALPNFTL